MILIHLFFQKEQRQTSCGEGPRQRSVGRWGLASAQWQRVQLSGKGYNEHMHSTLLFRDHTSGAPQQGRPGSSSSSRKRLDKDRHGRHGPEADQKEKGGSDNQSVVIRSSSGQSPNIEKSEPHSFNHPLPQPLHLHQLRAQADRALPLSPDLGRPGLVA